MFEVKKARRQRRPLKISLEALSGGGKTFTALRLAFAMRRLGIGKRIVVADSENESAGLYEGVTSDGEKWEYEVCPLPADKQNPVGYTECYEYLVSQGFDLIIVDSMTHAWKGALTRVDEIGARNKGDKFGSGWRAVTPEQEKMMRTLTDPRSHLITTTRVKGEYERVDGGNGRDKIKKVGMKADQRDGMEYEYDCVVRLEPEEHLAVVEKVRGCMAMDGRTGKLPGPEFWKPLLDWWKTGSDYVAPPAAPEKSHQATPPATPAEDDKPDRELVNEGFRLYDECTNRQECEALSMSVKAAKAKYTEEGFNVLIDYGRERWKKLPAAKNVGRQPGEEG